MNGGKLGIIGIGLLGSALAERLLGAGYSLLGYDLDRKARLKFQKLGGQSVRSAREVAAQCNRIVLCLPNADIAENVIAEMLPVASGSTIIIDTTTGLPEKMEELSNSLRQQLISYLDATIGGSSEQARAGKAIAIVGGEPEPFDSCRDIFDCFAEQTFHVGPPGSGAQIKLAVNLILGLNRAALAEGLKFAEALGLNLDEVLRVLKASPAYSAVMDTKGDKMLNEDFAPQAKLSQHLKDVRLILETGDKHSAYLPLSRLHKRMLKTAETNGYGESDNSAVIKIYDLMTKQPVEADAVGEPT